MLTTILGLTLTLAAVEPELDNAPAPVKPETIARDFRIEVYNTFREDRAEYDRRVKIGRGVWKSWINSGRNEQLETRVVQWFEDALNASRKDAIADLPTTDSLPQVYVSTERERPDRTPERDTRSPVISVDDAFETDPPESDLRETGTDDPAPTPDAIRTTTPDSAEKETGLKAIGRSLFRSFTDE